tara:strand:- start:94 stop:651 length:558 start_codon:yes stop_codon:yes gene_type:complete
MAKKEEVKPVLERIYIIPLRRQTLKVPYYRKAKKAIATIREFISKHMKVDEVLIGKYLNLEVWKNGMKNPPGKVKVNVSKDDKGVAKVELFGAPKDVKDDPKDKKEDSKKVEDKKEEKKTDADKKVEKIEKKIEKKEKVEKKEGEEKEKVDIAGLKKDMAEKEVPKTAPIAKKVEPRPMAPKKTE